MAIIADTDLATELGKDSADARMTRAAAWACQWIETECDRVFDSASYTHDLSGNGLRELPLVQYPVTAVSSVRIDDTWDFTASDEEDSDDYKISRDATGLVHKGKWPRGLENIRVAYTAGYSTMPNDLKALAIFLGLWFYWESERRSQGLTSKSDPSGSFSFMQDLPPLHRQTIANYRKRGL